MKSNKRNKTVMCLVICVMIIISSLPLSSCKGDSGIKIDETKTQLYISNYDAGIGRKWVENLGTKFEKAFASYPFESGKTGVQIIYDHNRNDTDTGLYSTIANSTNNIFFTENIDYVSFAKNKIRNVTDIYNNGAITGVDENGNFTRETTKIKNKISDEFLAFLNRGTETEEEYYAFPYYLAVKGLVYDIDLWNSKGLYIAKGECPSEIVAFAYANGEDLSAAQKKYYQLLPTYISGENQIRFVSAKDEGVELSAGPDGIYSTSDDGLPGTYEEFYLLLDKIVKESVVPFIWTGKHPGYADGLVSSLWQNYMGSEQMKVYYNLSGTANDLAVIENENMVMENGKPKTNSVDLGSDGSVNGYEVQRQVGKYYGLKFGEKIATNEKYTAYGCYISSISHITAQSKFVGSIEQQANGERIAMLIDGCWWQQESNDVFESMAKRNENYSKAKRNFGNMYLPNATIEKYTDRVENKTKDVIVAQNDSFCFINSNLKENSPQLKVAETFMSYIHSDEAMNSFTQDTNVRRALHYQISDETMEKITPYGKNLMEYIDKCDIVWPYTVNEFINSNHQYFINTGAVWNFHTYTRGKDTFTYAIEAMHNNQDKGVDAEMYFSGLYTYHKNNTWKQIASK